MLRLFLPCLLLIATPAMAQQRQPEWRQATEEQIFVRLGTFEPDPLRLEAGRPTRLVFFNGSRTRLSLQAGEFFANSYVRSGDADLVLGGGMVLDPGESRAVTLVPTAGRYRMRSGSWFRRLLGMSAEIIVEPGEFQQRSVGRSIDSPK